MSQYVRYPVVAGDGVESVFGRTGTVIAVSNDYTWAQIDKATSSLNDITTRQLIPAAAGDVGLTIKGHASQSGDLLDVTDSSNTSLFVIDSLGQVTMPNVGSNIGITVTGNDNMCIAANIGNGTAIYGSTSSATGFALQGQSTSGTAINGVTDTGVAAQFTINDVLDVNDVVIINDATAGVTSTVKMINVKNHSNTSVFSVTVAGNVANAGTIVSTGTVSAPNLNFVGCRYHNATATVTGTPSKLSYTTSDFDVGSGYSSGVYTVPAGKGGKYNILAQALVVGTYVVGNFVELAIYINNTLYSREEQLVGNAAINFLCFDINDYASLSAADTVEIRVSSDGTGPTINNSDSLNFLNIVRVAGS